MQWIRIIDNLLETLERALVVLIFSALILAILINISARNLFQISLDKLFELAPAMVVWLALLGASLAIKQRRHIRLELVLRYCPAALRRLADAAASLFGLVIMAILFSAAMDFSAGERAIFGSWGWISIVFPVFFALAGFRYFRGLLACFARRPEDASAGATASSPPRRPTP